MREFRVTRLRRKRMHRRSYDGGSQSDAAASDRAPGVLLAWLETWMNMSPEFSRPARRRSSMRVAEGTGRRLSFLSVKIGPVGVAPFNPP